MSTHSPNPPSLQWSFSKMAVMGGIFTRNGKEGGKPGMGGSYNGGNGKFISWYSGQRYIPSN